MKFEELTVGDLKKHAKGNVKGYTTMKKDDLVKHLKKGFKLMKGGNLVAKEPKGRTATGGRCWDGYEPVEDKKPYTKGSCKKVEGSGLEESRKKLKEALTSHMQILKGMHEHANKIRGGQLPCRVTEKMKGLQIHGGGFFKGDKGTMLCTPECYKPPECETARKESLMHSADPIMRYAFQGREAKCTKDAREKRGCPTQCIEGKRDSGLQRIGERVLNPLTKTTDFVLGAATVASKPAFMAGCAAAATSVGGPLAGAAGAAACGEIYNQMVKKPGTEDYMIKKSGLTDQQVKIVEKMTQKGIKASGGGLPWEEAPNFKGQFEKYNASAKKKFKDLASFADHIMDNKDKFQAKTVKRARFFKNVLQKKKSSQ